MYKIGNEGFIIRVSDGANIPNDPTLIDYQEYLDWIAAGNVPQPADIPDPKQKIVEQISTLEQKTQIPRVTREFMLASMENLAAGQGVSLDQLYQGNIGYRKVKDLDDQIKALRAQL